MIGALGALLAQVATDNPAGRPYFPPAMVAARSPCAEQAGDAPRPVISSLERDWFTKHLRAAAEPSLAMGARDVIRFTWLRSFHHTVSIRVEGLASARPRLWARELTGHGGYDAGKVGRRIERRLSPAEAAALRRTVSARNLFAQPPLECGNIGLDGAEWIMEGVDGRGYHLIVRWSPEAGPVREVGLAMLGLTGWRTEPIY